jgi:ribonucleotide monophosphatase NagD (HAD superfamily)
MVGDRLDTDILWGNAGGLRSSLLVMTGVTHQEGLDGADEAHRPTHVVDSFGSLGEWIEALAAAPPSS